MDEEMETEASKLILDDVEDFGVGRSFWTLLILDADAILIILDADDIGCCSYWTLLILDADDI